MEQSFIELFAQALTHPDVTNFLTGGVVVALSAAVGWFVRIRKERSEFKYTQYNDSRSSILQTNDRLVNTLNGFNTTLDSLLSRIATLESHNIEVVTALQNKHKEIIKKFDKLERKYSRISIVLETTKSELSAVLHRNPELEFDRRVCDKLIKNLIAFIDYNIDKLENQ